MQKKIVFLASGRGTNFAAVVEYLRSKKIEVEIAGLVSDKVDAPALDLAKSLGVPTFVVPFEKFRHEKEKFHLEMEKTIGDLAPDLVVTAGYMRILPASIIKRFENAIINIHPSLLPAFKGLRAIDQALEYGVRFAGCTTHFVEEGIDTGAIILQSIVEILPNMKERDLTAKIHLEEHKILPLSVEYFLANRLVIQGRKVTISE